MADPLSYDRINRLAEEPETAKDALIFWLMRQLLEARGQLIAVQMALKPRRNSDTPERT